MRLNLGSAAAAMGLLAAAMVGWGAGVVLATAILLAAAR